MTATVRVEEHGSIATMVLDRPARMNAMSGEMSRDVRAALSDVAASGARALVVRGEGSAFSAGADLHSLAEDIDLDDPAAVRDYVMSWSNNVLALRALPMPSIAAVEGPAYGGGFSFALACDIVIAASTARFNTQYVNIGINPDLGSSWTLPRTVGPARAALSDVARQRDLGHRSPSHRTRSRSHRSWGCRGARARARGRVGRSFAIFDRIDPCTARIRAGQLARSCAGRRSRIDRRRVRDSRFSLRSRDLSRPPGIALLRERNHERVVGTLTAARPTGANAHVRAVDAVDRHLPASGGAG